MEKISIIIRTYNESYWIPFLIKTLKAQTIQDFEVIQVDNQSSDNSVSLLQNSDLKTTLVNIENYLPGAALNRGIEQSKGEILVFLSAHCLPNSPYWLENLTSPVISENYDAVFGRQIPCRSTHPIDVRDLLLTFPNESHVQRKNTFFHNANSCVTKSLWMKFPFSESAKNIEDRLFGEQVIGAGIPIFYAANAVVTHQHGLHQTTNIDRLKGVTDILDEEGIIEYENENFVRASFSKQYVTIESRDESIVDLLSPSTTLITCNERLALNLKNAKYIPYQNNDKVLDILRAYAKTCPDVYICYYNWKTSSAELLDQLFNKLRIGDLAICYGRRIKNPILNSGYLNKGLLNAYSYDLRNAVQHELFFNKGLVIHPSVFLTSNNNDSIFQNIEVFEE